eukprot:5273492-Amphidinium_carterae.1
MAGSPAELVAGCTTSASPRSGLAHHLCVKLTRSQDLTDGYRLAVHSLTTTTTAIATATATCYLLLITYYLLLTTY